MNPDQLSELQLDALRELTHAGCGAAATALSQMLGGQSIDVEVVQSSVLEVAQLPERLGPAGQRLWGVELSFHSAIEGKLVLVYSEADAFRLAALLTGEPKTVQPEGLSELGRSAISELGNILASAYLTAMGAATRLILLPSIPTLISGDPEAIARSLIVEGAPGQVPDQAAAEAPESKTHFGRLLLLETKLKSAAPNSLLGHLLIAPREAAIGTLLSVLGL